MIQVVHLHVSIRLYATPLTVTDTYANKQNKHRGVNTSDFRDENTEGNETSEISRKVENDRIL